MSDVLAPEAQFRSGMMEKRKEASNGTTGNAQYTKVSHTVPRKRTLHLISRFARSASDGSSKVKSVKGQTIMDENKKVTTAAVEDSEYSKSAVPMSARKSFMSALIISLGYVFVVTSMQAGSSIGVGLSFSKMVAAVLVSSLILTVLSCIMGVIATKSGLSFGLLSQYSFGRAGTWVPIVIVAITTIGWFSIDAYLIGDSAHRLFTALPILPIAILGGLGMTLTAMKGTKWMNMLSNVAVPIILIFGVISIVMAFKDVGGIAGMNAIVKEDTLSFAKAVSLGVGSYAVGSVMFTPDIMRFAKNAKTSIIVMIITIMVGNSFMVFFGAIGSVVYNDPDIMGVLAIQGLLGPAFIVMVLNIWSTAQGCVYSGSMSLSSVVKMPRQKLVLIFGVLGIIFACIGFYNMFGTYINFLSSTVPPVVGIMLADFLMKFKNGYPDLDSLPTADVGGFVAWIAGFLVSYISIGLPSINCVVAAFIVKAVFNAVQKKNA